MPRNDRLVAVEAIGRPLQHVVRIIDSESREPVRNPLAMAMLQDEIVAWVRTACWCAGTGTIGHRGHRSPMHDSHGR